MNILGVDFGRVIHGGAGPDGAADTNFLGTRIGDAIKSLATPGALEVIPQLVAHFEGRVWIISKCGESVQRRRWPGWTTMTFTRGRAYPNRT